VNHPAARRGLVPDHAGLSGTGPSRRRFLPYRAPLGHASPFGAPRVRLMPVIGWLTKKANPSTHLDGGGRQPHHAIGPGWRGIVMDKPRWSGLQNQLNPELIQSRIRGHSRMKDTWKIMGCGVVSCRSIN
jgi:hypothetical protein